MDKNVKYGFGLVSNDLSDSKLLVKLARYLTTDNLHVFSEISSNSKFRSHANIALAGKPLSVSQDISSNTYKYLCGYSINYGLTFFNLPNRWVTIETSIKAYRNFVEELRGYR